MSVRIMSAAWETDLPDSDKIVLLALADCANDEGGCWPSMATLTVKCSKSERTVQGCIKSLVEKGHLTRQERLGKGCFYTVHPRRDCTPAEIAPPQGTTVTPAAAADKPSRTINTSEAKASSVKRAKKTKPKPALPEGVSAEQWQAFRDMRRAIRKPMTPRAEDLAIAKLRKLAADGQPPGKVLDQSILNSWQDIYPLKENPSGSWQPNPKPLNLRGSRPSPALDMWREANAELAAEHSASDQETDLGAWLALPAFGTS